MKIDFIASYYSFSQIPSHFSLPQIAIFGRSNAGKSSLINALFMKNIAKISSKPGKTQSLNFFELERRLHIVDLPGFGYSKVSNKQHKSMMDLIEIYLNRSKLLTTLLILCDSRRELPQDEVGLIETCYERQINPFLIRTKIDKLNQKEKAMLQKRSQILKNDFPSLSVAFTSNHSMIGIEELRDFFLTYKKDKK